MAFEALHRWAHRYAGGRWIALGGGGYEWVDVVPRAWTHLIAEATGHPIDPSTEVPDASPGRARSTRASTPTTRSTARSSRRVRRCTRTTASPPSRASGSRRPPLGIGPISPFNFPKDPTGH
jgi:hypothetical protein